MYCMMDTFEYVQPRSSRAMRILFHDPTRSFRARIRNIILAHWSDRWPDDWQVLSLEAPVANAVVLILPRLTKFPRVVRIGELRAKHPTVPVVLATRQEAEGLRRISEIPVQEVVWTSRLERSLPSAIRRAGDEQIFARLAHHAADRAALPSTLRRALDLAFRAAPPYPGVAQLADAVGRNRRTLWHHWNNLAGRENRVHLGEILTWIRLLRAAGMKEPHRSWRWVAQRLGLPERTLREQTMRVTDWTLGELESRSRRDLWRRFVRRLEEGELKDALELDDLAMI